MNGINVAEINIFTSTTAALIMLFIAVNVWRRRYSESALWFVGLVLTTGWVSCWYVVEAAVGYDVQAYISCCKFEYLGLTLIPLMWFGFSLSISGHERPFRPRVLALFLIIPLLTDILAFTNDWFGLIWTVPRFEVTPLGPAFSPIYGAGFWLNIVFAYVLCFAGTYVLIRRSFGAWRLYRSQTIIVLLGAIFPWISNILEIFDQLNPAPALNFTSIGMTIAIITLAIGVFRMRLLDVTPFTQDTILSHMPGGYVVTDGKDCVVAFNKNMSSYFNDENAIGKQLTVLLPLPSIPPQTAQQPFVWSFQDRILEISVTPMLDWRHRPRGNLYVLNDVTTRVEAEKAQHNSEMRQRALLKALPDLMFRLSRDGRYLDYHAANPEDLIADPEKFLGQNISALLPTDIVDYEIDLIARVLATGEIASHEYTLNLNGKPVDFEARIVASGADEVVSIVRNITEQREAKERAFALALEKERVTMLTRFIQESSHEFRTPLSIIQVNLHLLNKFIDAEKRAERVDGIQIQIERITHLVDMLVQMSRLDSGMPFVLRKTDANSVLQQAATKLYNALAKKNLRVEYELDENLPPIQSDEQQLLDAVIQIVDNAVRYTPADEAITLRTEWQDNTVIITVEDSGIGISESNLPHIFERFFRLDTAHSTPGFGLGLSIAQKIVELHGGSIRVQSQVGVGSTFSIHLPCVAQPETVKALAL
ncbi:MAG: histidine kinase N-terminal 7TM domain-containing protein [Chloroflexota bacterium]